MNDVVYEEVLIKVHDKVEIECIGVGLDPLDDTDEAYVIRKCGIMAEAIGQELAWAFDEENATKWLARLTHLALGKLAETLEEKSAE